MVYARHTSYALPAVLTLGALLLLLAPPAGITLDTTPGHTTATVTPEKPPDSKR